MNGVWVLAAGAVGLVALVLWRRRGDDESDVRERPVLPSQYSSLLQVDPSRYPGLCTACGTENTPGYNFCRECGEELSGGTRDRSDVDVSEIFGE